MANWPASLPQQVLLDGYGESAPDGALRTQMDAGPAKLRRRTTAVVRTVSGAVVLDASQVATLDSFYLNSLSGGTLAFDWTHPRTLAAASFRFTAPPAYVPIGGGHWRASLALEILP